MRAGVAMIVMAAAMLLPSTAMGARHDMMPSWAWAWVDDAPFHDPNTGALLGPNAAYPRGQVKDRGTPDGYSVKMTVTVHGLADELLHRYEVADGSAVYRSLDRSLTLAAPVKSVRYELCTVPAAHCVDYAVARPAPAATPVPQPAPAVDRDLDGVPEPVDCNDTNSSVRPGATEIAGNGLDDDCAGGDQAAKMPGFVKNKWRVTTRTNPRVRIMQVRDALPDAQVTVACTGRGCPFKLKRRTTDRYGEVSLTKLFKRPLRGGIRLEVHVAAPNVITKVTRFDIRRGVLPSSRSLCIPVGALKPQRRC